MGVLEWVGAHLLGPIISLYRTIQNKPRPELKIHELAATGGGTNIDFQVVVQNVGTKTTRATITARVGDEPVQVLTPVVELLPNAASQTVQIRVPRPHLGDLVKEFNSETTLYGGKLVVEVADGNRRLSETWTEHMYTPEEDRERHEIQQRVWRRGHGEETEADARAEAWTGVSERLAAKGQQQEDDVVEL